MLPGTATSEKSRRARGTAGASLSRGPPDLEAAGYLTFAARAVSSRFATVEWRVAQ